MWQYTIKGWGLSDWCQIRLPAVSFAVSGYPSLGDQDSLCQEAWYPVVLHDTFRKP